MVLAEKGIHRWYILLFGGKRERFTFGGMPAAFSVPPLVLFRGETSWLLCPMCPITVAIVTTVVPISDWPFPIWCHSPQTTPFLVNGTIMFSCISWITSLATTSFSKVIGSSCQVPGKGLIVDRIGLFTHTVYT